MTTTNKIYFAIVITIIFVSSASASYITGNIYLDESGNARFDIETDKPINLTNLNLNGNHLTGTTNELLALKGGIWTFDLTTQEYDDIFVEIHLPKNLVSIKTVEGSDHIIDIEQKTVTIAASGRLEFKIDYILKEKTSYVWAYWIGSILILIIGFFIYRKVTRKKERFENILPMINDKEQQIIDLLMKKPMRQKELRNQLNLPKASFSRYMVNLEKKKLILREGEGKNKLVKLK